MMSGENAWRAVATFAIKVMTAKERAERERERRRETAPPALEPQEAERGGEGGGAETHPPR